MNRSILFILITLLIQGLSTLSAQSESKELVYLRENAATWNNGFENIERVLNSEVLQNQLFLVGESHGIQYNDEIHFDLMTYLHQKAGLKYIMLELGFLDQIYLQRYLDTGNEKVLDSFFYFHPGTAYFNKSSYEFYKKLYAYNQKLPAEARIKVFSVDIEHGFNHAIAYLQREVGPLLPVQEKALYDSLNTKKDSLKHLIGKFNKVYDSYRKNNPIYRQALKNHYEDASHLLENIYQRFELIVTRKNDRDSLMYRNYLYAKQRYSLNDEKILAFMGSFHVKQQDTNDPRMATMIRKLGGAKGIVSFQTVYNGGEAMVQNRLNRTNPFNFVSIRGGSPSRSTNKFEMLQPFFDSNKGYLFYLNKMDSPFKYSDAFTQSDEPFTTTELFQILIFLNHSPATRPYDE